jgi:hypothetical protein
MATGDDNRPVWRASRKSQRFMGDIVQIAGDAHITWREFWPATGSRS